MNTRDCSRGSTRKNAYVRGAQLPKLFYTIEDIYTVIFTNQSSHDHCQLEPEKMLGLKPEKMALPLNPFTPCLSIQTHRPR